MPKKQSDTMKDRECVKKKIKIEPDLGESSSSESEEEYEKKRDQARREKVKCEPTDVDAEEIREILERKRAEEQLPPSKVQCLRQLVIKLRHKVPPQHEIERACGSHVPTADEKKSFAEIIHPNHMRKGVFTPHEDQTITDNWKAFCKNHNWSSTNPQPFMYMRHNIGFYLAKWNERKKFVQYLADGLPYRTLYSVYHRFRNLYDPKVRTKYSYQEDQYIIKHIEQTKNVDETRMYADLAKVLNRTRASVWRRYRLLKKKRMEQEFNE